MQSFSLDYTPPPTPTPAGPLFQIDDLIPEETRVATTACCNAHDTCYGTCDRSKDECDTEFDTCLSAICTGRLSFYLFHVTVLCIYNQSV